MSAELVAAFGRLRALWKRLFEEIPEEGEGTRMLEGVRRDLAVVSAAARISEEAVPYVELAYRVRMGLWAECDIPPATAGAARGGSDPSPAAGPPGGPRGTSLRERLPAELEEAAEGVRAGFELRMRTLRQMESGDEVLPDQGRDSRRAASRDLHFFRELIRLARRPPEESSEQDFARIAQSFDARRRLVREDLHAPAAALEAVEFLVRLGAT